MVTDDYRGLPKGSVRPVVIELCSRYQNGSEKWYPAVATPSWCMLHAVTSSRSEFKSKKRPIAADKADLKVDRYDKLIATHPEIERKGAANPYTSLNGHMFTLLHDSRRLAIRMPEDKREEFLKKHKTTLFEAYGIVMKEYVAVPDAMLKNTKELEKYLELSYEYVKNVKTLKPKATKKTKKS